MLAAVAVLSLVLIQDDKGGLIETYIERYQALQASKAQVQIQGHCLSACTLILGLVDRDRVCVVPGATLGFHSAKVRALQTYSASGTERLWSIYPPDVRAKINARGWDGLSPHPEFLTFEGAEFYPPCTEGTQK